MNSLSIFLFSMASILVIHPALALENNVSISGNLVTEPCTLDPTASVISLDFGTVVNKYFQTASRTPGMPFTIQLIDCDITLGKNVTVTFGGNESTGLPGLLMPDGGSTAGLAFGIETVPNAATGSTAQPVPINQPSQVFSLSEGSSAIHLQGYIQALPDAIANNSIQSGPFIATATFQLDYP